MQLVNISDAKTHLSALIERVVNDNEAIIIGKAGKPVAKIVRYYPTKDHQRIGLLKGQIEIKEDFDEWPSDIAEALDISTNK